MQKDLKIIYDQKETNGRNIEKKKHIAHYRQQQRENVDGLSKKGS